MPRSLLIALAIIGLGAGCAPRAVRRPPPPPPAVQRGPRLEQELLGAWELPRRGGLTGYAQFKADGTVTFQNGLEFLNPARWSLDSDRQELTLHFPQTADEKLDIFQLYVGQGVKSFDRPGRTVTYHFGENTTSLNLAGWEYQKPEHLPPPPAASQEPVLN